MTKKMFCLTSIEFYFGRKGKRKQDQTSLSYTMIAAGGLDAVLMFLS